MDKWDYIKLKNLCVPENTISIVKRGKVFAEHISDKELISEYIKNPYN